VGYVALRRMKIDGRWVNPGDPLPGAENWKHLHALISQGYVAGYPDPPQAESKGNGKKQQQRRSANQDQDGQANGEANNQDNGQATEQADEQANEQAADG
jgi:hypothetical protein